MSKPPAALTVRGRFSFSGSISNAILARMADSARKLVILPADLMEAVKREAAAQGVSANAFIANVLAAAVGYRLPEK